MCGGGFIGDAFDSVGDVVGDVAGGIGDAVGSIGNALGDALPTLATIGNFIPGPWTPFTLAYSGLNALNNGDLLGALGAGYGLSGGGGLSDLFGSGSTGGGISGDMFSSSGASSLGDMSSMGGLGSGISASPNSLGYFKDIASTTGDLVGGMQIPSFANADQLGSGITGSIGNYASKAGSGLGDLFGQAGQAIAKNPFGALKTGVGLYNMFNQPQRQQRMPQYAGGYQQQQQFRPAHRRYA